MKQFKQIFGKVMIEVTPVEVAMLGADVPVVAVNGQSWAEFSTWANKSFHPNLEIAEAFLSEQDETVRARIRNYFTRKSASTLSAHFNEWEIYADDVYDTDGRPFGTPELYLSIPYV